MHGAGVLFITRMIEFFRARCHRTIMPYKVGRSTEQKSLILSSSEVFRYSAFRLEGR